MTQLLKAGQGLVTPEMTAVAASEKMAVENLCLLVATGEVVIPANRNHAGLKPLGIGKSLRTKVNANIGNSQEFPDAEAEVKKMRAAIEAGADAVMDLSTGGDPAEIRKLLLPDCPLPFGTVPVYQVAVEARRRSIPFVDLTASEMIDCVAGQAEEGVDFMTIHAGLTRGALRSLQAQGRITGIVSRGGALMVAWMLRNESENPYFAEFDRILDICRQHDVTLSLGDGLRPGCLADGTDRAQVHELLVLGELVDRCRRAGVQVMVEGPGHLPLSQVAVNVQLQKSLCRQAPFYVLGPLVTDIAPGYDHISAAIGGAAAAAAGADFLCYVTATEHLGLPNAADVREGVMAARIAAHAGDIAKGLPGALDWDLAMARARRDLDWQKQEKLCLDPQAFRARRRGRETSTGEACSMCGDYCVFKVLDGVFEQR